MQFWHYSYIFNTVHLVATVRRKHWQKMQGMNNFKIVVLYKHMADPVAVRSKA